MEKKQESQEQLLFQPRNFKMKKILNILISSILISLYLNIFVSYTQAISITPSPTENLTQEQINALTNRIASRVAQLKLVEKRGVIGKVTDVSNTKITLSDIGENTRFVDVDEFTKFNSSSKSFGISDIEKGQKIGVLGLYNKQSRRILARFVEVLQIPDFIHGAVSEVDSKNFSIEVALENRKRINIEVENSTKTLSFNREKSELVKSGFSKITEGENIIIIGFPSKKNSNITIASKIILLPGISKNPKIKIFIKPQVTLAPTSSPTPTISSKKTTSY